ncbi:MAG: hypothetical protein IJ193_02535 [Bacilli bacterium]|nr:hypothetical protein [Bacilli bacterium]
MKNKKIGYIFIAIGITFMVGAFLVNNYVGKNQTLKEEKTDTIDDNKKNKNYVKEENGEVSLETESSDELVLDDFSKATLFHYDEVEKDVLADVNKNHYSYYLSTCEGKMPDVTTSFIELKESSFQTIMKKLRSCTRYESNITASFFCPKYSYAIGMKSEDSVNPRIFSLNYANDSKVLIVGYKNVGYAFYYEEDVTGFIESLQ